MDELQNATSRWERYSAAAFMVSNVHYRAHKKPATGPSAQQIKTQIIK
jgi:hypothetical protein